MASVAAWQAEGRLTPTAAGAVEQVLAEVPGAQVPPTTIATTTTIAPAASGHHGHRGDGNGGGAGGGSGD